MNLVKKELELIIDVLDVDMGDMTIVDTKGEKYKLLDASRDYLQDLSKCIEIGLEEREEEAL